MNGAMHDDDGLTAEDRLLSVAYALVITEERREAGSLELAGLKKGRLDRSPKKNWIEETGGGGLPRYIEDIALALERKGMKPLSRAIATAISQVKRWARGGENVNADTRAKAAKAVAQWTALKARNRARMAKKGD